MNDKFPIPDDVFTDIIGREVMFDPVVACDGFTYERAAIEHWFKSGKNTSPTTNQPMLSQELIPNLSLRAAIGRWADEAATARAARAAAVRAAIADTTAPRTGEKGRRPASR
jgi:hypothetical protein